MRGTPERDPGLRWPRWSVGLTVFVLLAVPASVGATVTEPPIAGSVTGEMVPNPTSAAELSLVTARGFSSAAGTLQGLFASRGETIDSVKDAQTSPGAFSPACNFTGALVMRV